MAPRYLNEFHKRNSQACREALRSSARQPLSVEDVLEQSRRNGRSTARRISSAAGIFRKRS